MRKEEEKIIKNDFTEALFAQISDEIFIINFDNNNFFYIFFFQCIIDKFYTYKCDALYAIH